MKTTGSWKFGFAAAVLSLAVWASPAGAQRSDEMKGGGGHPCTGDAQRICSEFIPDRGKVASCLFKNKAKLTSACRSEIGGGKSAKAKGKGKGRGKAKRSKKKR